MTVPSRICCAVDFTDSSHRAMRAAAELANRLGAELTLLYVPAPSLLSSGCAAAPDEVGMLPTEEAELTLQEWKAEASSAVQRSVDAAIAFGDPHRAILDHVHEHHCDLVVSGMDAGGALDGGGLGAVTERLVRDAPCPVLVSRPAESGKASEVLPGEAERWEYVGI